MTTVAQEGLTWQDWLGRLNLNDAQTPDINYIEHLTDLITHLSQLVYGELPERGRLDDIRIVGSRAAGSITTPVVCLGNDMIGICITHDPISRGWVVSVRADHLVYKHFLGRLRDCPQDLMIYIPTYWHYKSFSSNNRKEFTGFVKSDYDLYAFMLILFSDRLSKPE